jgi:hypothetical protein
MNDTTPSARYHRAYDDTHYKLIRASIAHDLDGDEAAVATLMNAVTNAASEAVGWPGFEGSLTKLAGLPPAHDLSDGTVFLLTRYLARFEGPGARHAETFEMTVKMIQTVEQARPDLLDAAAGASRIPSASGNAAHHLLRAANLLTLTAVALLKGDSHYALEKYGSAWAHTKNAARFAQTIEPPFENFR